MVLDVSLKVRWLRGTRITTTGTVSDKKDGPCGRGGMSEEGEEDSRYRFKVSITRGKGGLVGSGWVGLHD